MLTISVSLFQNACADVGWGAVCPHMCMGEGEQLSREHRAGIEQMLCKQALVFIWTARAHVAASHRLARRLDALIGTWFQYPL